MRNLAAVVAVAMGTACEHQDGALPGPDAGPSAAACVEPAVALDPELADVAFPSLDGPLRLADLRAGCDEPPDLLVVRIGAGWCGSCDLLMRTEARDDRHLRYVDVLLADAENAPPSERSERAHRALPYAAGQVLRDPDALLTRGFPERVALPLVLVLDAHSLALRDRIAAATPESLDRSTARALGRPQPVAPAPRDGLFSASEWALLEAMSITALRLPEGNDLLADDPRAAALGKALFFDTALSPGGVACGSCHQVERGLASPDPTAAQGLGAASRNVPSVLYAAYQPYQFWDGRADSLVMQAVAPFENPAEMGGSRVHVARRIAAAYASAYDALFGNLLPFADLARFPEAARPGEPSWERMAPADRDAVTIVLGNAARALAAYERALPRVGSRFDRYVAGAQDALFADEKAGVAAFLRAGCPQCHYGPLLSDGAFHNLRVATGRHDLSADPGRSEGLRLLRDAERFGGALDFDRIPTDVAPSMLGAFKTPPLRDVASTPPYGHGGGYASLRAIVELHRAGGEPVPSKLAVGTAERWLAPFGVAERDAIVRFLAVLTSQVSL